MILARLCGSRRVYLRGRRVHHGPVGVALIALGIFLVLDDLHDWPWRLIDP